MMKKDTSSGLILWVLIALLGATVIIGNIRTNDLKERIELLEATHDRPTARSQARAILLQTR